MRLAIPRRRPRRGWLPVPGLVLSAAMALAACGGDASAEPTESDDAAPQTGSGGGAASSGRGGLPDDEVILDFYQCLRDNGIDIEDPDLSGGGVRIGGGAGGGAIDPNDPEQMAVLEDCRDETGLGGPGGAQGGNFGGNLADTEALIEFASCMRENGVDWPDPTAEGAFQIPEGVDPSSPEVQAASDECREHLVGGGVMVTR